MTRSQLAKSILLAAALLSHAILRADIVHLASGNELQGRLIGMQANFVELEISDGEQTAVRRISPLRIARLDFEDADASLERRALRRVAFLGALNPEDERLIIQLLDDYLSQGRALEALAYAKLWQAKLEYADTRKGVARQLIQAALAANLVDEAAAHARNWIAAFPDPGGEPLAWQVLAQSSFDAAEYEKALWIALKPIAFSRNASTKKSTTCYAIAIAAYSELGYDEYALALRSELEHPELHYPDPVQTLTPPSLLAQDLTFQRILKTVPQP